MSNKCKNLKGQSKNVTEVQKSTLDIHIAFKQHGERLFIRGEDGQYSHLVIRALFEVFNHG